MKKPRPHQQLAITAANTALPQGDRHKLIMACGTGKTLTALWIAQQQGYRRILIAVPTLYLQGQALTEWQAEMGAIGLPHEVLAVGSDKTLGHTYDVPVTTDADEVRQWLSVRQRKSVVILTTYASGGVVAEASRKAGFEWDIIIFDEAHRTAGFEDKNASLLLHEANIKARKRLFMTATERFISSNLSEYKIYSMDDEVLYGQTFYDLPMGKAIEDGILSDYRMVTLYTDSEEVRKLLRDNPLVSLKWKRNLLDEEMQHIAAGIGLLKAVQELGLKRIITYHSSIKRAQRFADVVAELARVMEIENIETFHANSNHSHREKLEVIDDFSKSKIGVLTNARLFSEGFDLPAVDAVMCVDPRYSISDIVQLVGRALRKSPKKELAYICIPILTEDTVEKTNYKILRKIIRALASQDGRLVEKIRKREKLGNRAPKDDILQEITATALSVSFGTLQKAINLSIWKDAMPMHYRSYAEAKAWVEEVGLKDFGIVHGVLWKQYARGGLDIPNLPKFPGNIPINLEHAYAEDEFTGYKDFLNTNFLPYTEAKAWMWANHLGVSSVDYKSLSLPYFIPKAPLSVYTAKGEWISWSHYAGTSRQKVYFSYEEAKTWIKEHYPKITSSKQFIALDKKQFPAEMPKAPKAVYEKRGEWVSWMNFFE